MLARFTRAVRESPAVDPRSGVSARFAIAAAETVAAAALRRAALLGEPIPTPVARVGDTESVTGTLRGKVEFEADGEGREIEILDHLLRRAVAETWRARLGGLDLTGFVDLAAEGHGVDRPARRPRQPSCSSQVGTVPGLAQVLGRLGFDDVPTPARRRARSSSCSRACT